MCHSVHGGGGMHGWGHAWLGCAWLGACMAWGDVWLGTCITGGMHGRGMAGGICGWGHARLRCMAGGAWLLDVHGWGCAWLGACITEGMHGGGGHVWLGERHAWLEACMTPTPTALLTVRFEVVLQLFFSHGDQVCTGTIKKMPNPERANIQDMCQ